MVEVHKDKIVRFDDITNIYDKIDCCQDLVTSVVDSVLCDFTPYKIIEEIASFNESGPIKDLSTTPHLLFWLRGVANLKAITDKIPKPAGWTYSCPGGYAKYRTGPIGYIERVDKYHQYCIFIWNNFSRRHSYLYNLNTGNLIYDYKGYMSFFKDIKDTFFPKKFKVLVENKNIALIDEDKIIEYREMPADLFCNVNVFHSNENDGYDSFYFYKNSASQIEYFDTNFCPLKCSYADEIPNVTSIIENYLYKVDGLLYPVSKDDDIRHLTQRNGDILLVTSKSALKELNNSLS